MEALYRSSSAAVLEHGGDEEDIEVAERGKTNMPAVVRTEVVVHGLQMTELYSRIEQVFTLHQSLPPPKGAVVRQFLWLCFRLGGGCSTTADRYK